LFAKNNNIVEYLALKEFLGELAPLRESAWQALVPVIRKRSYEKHSIISRQGEQEDKLAWLMEGICRARYVKKDRELTVHFNFAPEFTGCPEAFVTHTHAKYYVDCLSPATVFELSRKDLLSLLPGDESVAEWYRGLSQAILLQLVKRHHNLYAMTAKDKTKELITHDPGLLREIPEDHLASYLGVAIHELPRFR
jgi:CRP-like cAMP-binding protein